MRAEVLTRSPHASPNAEKINMRVCVLLLALACACALAKKGPRYMRFDLALAVLTAFTRRAEVLNLLESHVTSFVLLHDVEHPWASFGVSACIKCRVTRTSSRRQAGYVIRNNVDKWIRRRIVFLLRISDRICIHICLPNSVHSLCADSGDIP